MKVQEDNAIDNYISEFSGDIKARLQEVRQIIRNLALEAEEKISYGIPTFTFQNSNLVHYAAYSNHIGFYPTPVAAEEFKEELSKYKCGKGSVQFPYTEKLPIDLIEKIVKFRMEEISNKALRKKPIKLV